MKKLLLVLFILFFLPLSVQAKAVKGGISSVVKTSGVNQNRIYVSIKDVETGKVVYSKNDDKLVNPASVQKLLTIIPIVETLGEDYEFSTELYSRGEDSYVLKLGADPYLSSKDLKAIVKNIPVETNRVYIADSILDNKLWGDGWQEEDLWDIYTPPFGSYNLDKNLMKLTIMPSERGQNALIINPTGYPFVFRNNVITSDTTDVLIEKDNAISENILVLTGTVSHPVVKTFPVINLKKYFNFQLKKALENRKVYLKEAFVQDRLKPSDEFVYKYTHSIDRAVDDVLKNSNNLVAETLFKLAGGKYCNSVSGSDVCGIKMFNEYCKRNNLNNSEYKVVDGSGVSKDDYVTANFVTDFLIVNKNNPIIEKLAAPGEGTLSSRLLPLKDSMKAKTGTHSDISSLAGFLTSKNGKKYAFCIINNDMKFSESDRKSLEDYIIREAYLRL